MAKLVAIGDSLTQGFQSLAITHTDLSVPALIAECMGMSVEEFRTPDFRGAGGLPCNVEWLARRLEEAYGADLTAFEWARAVYAITELLDEVEDYWERGRGSLATRKVDYHNLGVWGFEVADAYQLTAGMCRERFRKDKDDWFKLPAAPRERTGYRVLNPSQDPARDGDTQIDVAARIAREQGGIDHLIVWLGANNCLATVVELHIDETGDAPPGPFSGKTLWSERAFRANYEELGRRVKAIGAKNVYLATVPKVTIPPITRGVNHDRGRLREGEKYFDFYTRFWIRDKEFDEKRDPKLTKAEAEYIDQRIEAYNRCIRDVAAAHGFHFVDIGKVLDDLAVRRNHGRPSYPLPRELADLSIRFFEIEPKGTLRAGGLISLDGVHPTACGYSLVAQEFINVMNAKTGANIRGVDFGSVRKWDLLVSQPPRTLNDMFGLLSTLEKKFHMSRWMRPGE